MQNNEYLVGQQVGNYCLDSLIDSGSYGSVYLARHHIFTDDPPVALKLMHAYLGLGDEQALFFQEARLLRKLKHPAILPVVDVGFANGRPYLVTEFAPGGSLRDLLLRQKGQALPLTEALRILLNIGQALYHAHQQNVFHRDLKPENILFNERGEALLADFGIAVALASAHTYRVGQGGTPAYMAPEQFEGLVSPKSDQYALACLGYELLTGRKPFIINQASLEMIWYHHAHMAPLPPRQLNPAIPPQVEQALFRALSKDRTARYADVAAFLRYLCEPFFSEALLRTHSIVSAKLSFLDESKAALSAGSYRLKGETLYNEERYREALLCFEKVVALDPVDVHAYARLGNTLYALERYQESLEAYARALELDPHNAALEIDRAMAFMALKHDDRALEACASAQRLDPQNASAYAVQGNIYLALGLDEGAWECYSRAIELDPHNFLYYRYRGDALRWLGRDEEALASYDQALVLKPASREAYVKIFKAKAHAYYNLERYITALDFYSRALELDTGNADIYFHRGQALYHLQRYEEALKDFDRASALKSDFARCHEDRGYTLYQLNRYEEALIALDRSLAIEPDNAILYNAQGNILYTLRRYTDALQMYEKAIEVVPENLNFHENRARTLKKLAAEAQ